MLYNSKQQQASVLDIVRHLSFHRYNYAEYFAPNENAIYNRLNISLYEKVEDTFVEVEYTKLNKFASKITLDELQKCELELIELVRNIDVSTYRNHYTEADEDFLNTDYEKMYDEDTTEVFFKAYVIAIAQLIQQKLNVSFNEALLKCTKFDIYDRYMQAEPVDEIVEYAIEYKLI